MKKFSTVFLFLFMGCSGNRVSTAGVEVPDRGNTVALSTPEKIEKNEMKDEGSEVTITLAAVGDIMAHLPQIKGAWNREKKSYDFMKSFADIGPSIWRADFAMGNLEAPLAGKSRGYSGFPSFNCPESILAPLKAIGFDLLTTANNHALDRGWQGVISTIRFLKSYGFYHTGTFLSEEDYNKPLVVDIKGIKLCFIAETYHANGLEKVFKGKMKHYGVKYIRNSNQKKDVQKCRSAGADKVVFSIHWGNEYMRYPMTMVKNLEKRYIKAGADIIIGSHPHFVQPFRVQNVKTGNNSTKKVVTAWSMGNFISGMRAQYADTGMILYIDIRKNLKTGKVSIGKLSWVPTWVDRDGEVGGKREYRVIPVGRFLFDSELFSTLKPTSQVRLKQVWQESLEVPGITHGLPLVE